MAQVTRSTKVSGGTTLQSNTLARAADVETDMLTLFNAHNNHDTGSSSWTVVSAIGSSTVPLTADNSSGTQNIANFKDNGTTVMSVADGGIVTIAPGGTTKVVANSSGLTLSNSATLAMGSAKITGLANGTASTDAAAFGQVKYLQATQATTTTSFSTTSSTFQDTGFAVTITPSSASNRVKLTMSGQIYNSNTLSTTAQITLTRGTSNLASTNGMAVLTAPAAASNTSPNVPVTLSYIDSPASASAVTYRVYIRSTDNATTVTFASGTPTCVFIAEEIV